LSATLTNEDGSELIVAKGGEIVCLSIEISANENFASPLVGFVVKDRIGQVVFGDNTSQSPALLMQMEESANYLIQFYFEMPLLQNGKYAISAAVGCGNQDNHTHFHWAHDVLLYNVLHTRPCFGVVGIQTKLISVKRPVSIII
jgi:lipopolysaccharide transport system ATP-binding protein